MGQRRLKPSKLLESHSYSQVGGGGGGLLLVFISNGL
jgi:hypothetical protein